MSVCGPQGNNTVVGDDAQSIYSFRGAVLENVADSYDHQVEARIQTTMSLLEPILILGVGVFAGGIAFSILVPLMRINEFVQ